MKYVKIIGLIVTLISMNMYPGDAEKILENVRNKYNNIEDLSAVVTQSGKNPVFSGTIYYKKGDKFLLELQNMNIISNGNVIWNYYKKENKVIISNAGSEENSIFSFRTLLEVYPSQSILSSTKDGSYDVLILTPKAGTGINFSKAQLWINRENLVEKVEIMVNQQNNLKVMFSGYKLNSGISDNRFVFEIPKGSSVIDLR